MGRTAFRENPFGHGTDDQLTDGAMSGDQSRRDSEKGGLGSIAVSHKTFQKHGRGARDIRDPVRKQTPSAGLSRSKGQMTFRQHPNDALLHRVILHGKEMITYHLKNEWFHGIKHRLGADQSKIDLIGTGTVTDLKIAALGELQPHFRLQQRFPHPDNAVDAAFMAILPSGLLAEERDQVSGCHRLQFPGGTGQEKDVGNPIPARNVETRRGAVVIGKDSGSLRNHGLSRHALLERKSPTTAAFLDPIECLLMEVQFSSRQLRRNLPGNVIRGWAEPSCHNQQIGTCGSLQQKIPDRGAVGNRTLPRDPKTQWEDLLSQPLEVGIADGSEQKLTAGIEKFDPHCSAPVSRPSQRSTIDFCQRDSSTE